MTEVATRNSITLKGSAQIIQQFFHYGIHSILYQRGLYPPDNFAREKKYGMTLLVSNDPKIQKFLKPLLEHVESLLAKNKLKKLVLVITDVATKEVYERWQFDIEADPDVGESTAKEKDEKRIKQEMSDVLRQITASVAFLPLLENRCSFDVLESSSLLGFNFFGCHQTYQSNADYESALSNVIFAMFQNIEAISCLFHLCQSEQKWAKKHGMARLYVNEDLKEWIVLFPKLAYLPVNDVISSYRALVSEYEGMLCNRIALVSDEQKVTAFLTNIRKT